MSTKVTYSWAPASQGSRTYHKFEHGPSGYGLCGVRLGLTIVTIYACAVPPDGARRCLKCEPKVRACVDCGSTTRKLDFPGPRDGQCHRKVKRARSAASHDAMVGKVYGLEPGDYERLYAFQGGRCYICEHAQGKRIRLAVDHDHVTGEVRGLLCKICNRLLGIAGDKPDLFQRGIAYLAAPPYRRMKEAD